MKLCEIPHVYRHSVLHHDNTGGGQSRHFGGAGADPPDPELDGFDDEHDYSEENQACFCDTRPFAPFLEEPSVSNVKIRVKSHANKLLSCGSFFKKTSRDDS